MKAAVFHDQRDLRVDDLPEPETSPGGVKIEVSWCGICGSDLHEYLAGPIFIPPSGSPHPLTGEELPVVLGHEFGGRVVEVGDGVSRVEVGDRVAVEPIVYCGECPECRRGAYNLCRKLGFYGLSGGGGGFSELAVVPEYMAHRLPEELSDEESALVEPVAVGLHAVRQAEFSPGQTAIVFGAGPIGATTVQCLRAAGASLVVVAEVSENRKEMARKIGADAVIDPQEEDVVEAVQRLTDGIGVDASFDAAGVQETLNTAFHTTARGGKVVNVAIWEQSIELQPNDMVLSEVEVVGSIAYANEFPATMALMKDDRVNAGNLVTKRISLSEIVEEGFEELAANRDRHVKILVQP
jgi:(R,R)-butanediol dehydrogenase / meso-butanediol dehydrogenase / diacetyl reductase